jgi:hypothetical protein
MKKDLEKMIKTDHVEGDCSQPSWPPPAGHPTLATPLFLSPHDILKKKKSEKIIEIDEKKL